MTDEKKQEFTRRLTLCNKGELIVIVYDIFFSYLNEVYEQWDFLDASHRKARKEAVRKCDGVLLRLEEMLDFRYELANELFSLYEYSRRRLSQGLSLGEIEKINDAKSVMQKLYDAFVVVAKEDVSPTLMGNAQAVYSGYTYGRDSMDVGFQSIDHNRGYLA